MQCMQSRVKVMVPEVSGKVRTKSRKKTHNWDGVGRGPHLVSGGNGWPGGRVGGASPR